METQTAELDINFYDIIFKTIYLFLETNDFQESAATFLSEIRQRYHKDVDLQLIHPKTLVLRPLCNASPKSTSNNDPSSIQLIVNIPGDQGDPCLSITENEHSVQSTPHYDNANLKLRTIICRKSSDVNGPKSGSQAVCPECQLLTKSQDELEHICQLAVSLVDDDERCNWNQLYALGESIRALREEHHKMIALIADLKKEIAMLNPMSRSVLMGRCHAQLNELISYPGNHGAGEDLNMLQEPDELTEDQVESSVINSTPGQSIAHDLVIPLESKNNVGDIPQLIIKRHCNKLELPKTSSPQEKSGSSTILKSSDIQQNSLPNSELSSGIAGFVNQELTTVLFSFPDSAGLLPVVTEGGEQELESKNEIESAVKQKCPEFPQKLAALDVNWIALKRAMFDGDATVKVKVLQALRWRLTQTEPTIRDRHLLNFVKQDILSLNANQPHGQLFLESFFCPKKAQTPCVSQEEMARFLNTLASLSMGRLYLEHDESVLSVMILPLLMDKLPGVQISPRTRTFILAIVQKLSLGNKLREVIISCGTVEWLVQYINIHHTSQSTYEAEYSVALLTNLCINKEARNRCERIAERVVSLLKTLIDTPHRCCINYINPLLFSLLLNAHINEKAIAQGISIKLKRLYKVFRFDEELMRQFDAIVQMHHTREFYECDDTDADEVDAPNFGDYIEPELNSDEEKYVPPVGEDLLKTYCVRSAPQSPSRRDVIKQLSTVQIVRKNPALDQLKPKPVAALRAVANRPPSAKPGRVLNRRVTNAAPGTQQTKLRVPPVKQPTAGKMKAMPKVNSRWAKDAPMPQIGSRVPVPKQACKQFIVNCCYKMDYTNAIIAPPGEFVPHLPTMAETSFDGRKRCECIKDMQQYVENVQHIKESSESSSEATKSNGVVPVRRRMMDNNKCERMRKLTITDYHILSTGTESTIVGVYRGKSRVMCD